MLFCKWIQTIFRAKRLKEESTDLCNIDSDETSNFEILSIEKNFGAIITFCAQLKD